MRARHSYNAHGFTLVELLVVLTIMMLIMSVAPALYSAVVPGARVKESAARLAADLRLLRNSAVVSGQATEATLNPGDGTYMVSTEPDVRELARNVAMAFQKPEQTEREVAPFVIRFYPDGSSTGGTIVLTSGKATARVEVSWLTGRVSHGG